MQAPQTPDAGQEYASALNAYLQNAPQLYKTESQYQPMYNQLQQQMQLSNIQAYGQQFAGMVPQMQDVADMTQGRASQAALTRTQQFGGPSYQAMLQANPALAQMSQFAQSQLGAGQDPALQGILGQTQQALPGQVQGFRDLSSQVGRDIAPINQTLQGLSGQVGQQTAQTSQDLAGIRDKLAADPRSALWTQTAGAVSGQLGNLDPLTQQLSDTAQQQLALGGSLSEQQKQDATQAARAAFSSRGLLASSGAMAAEVLGRQSYMQQLLQQREQFAAGVDPLVQQQIQQRTANALGMSQADIAATQANLGAAGQLTQGIGGLQQAGAQLQGGLQGQIAGNVAQTAQLQGGLLGQAVSTQQGGYQQQAALQQAILAQQQQSQQMGASGLQYLSGMGMQNLAGITGAPVQGAAYAQQGGAQNIYGIGGPSLFESSGLLSLTNQNAMAQMNAQGQAGMVNAQAGGAARGQMIGAGAAIAGTVLTSAVLL